MLTCKNKSAGTAKNKSAGTVNPLYVTLFIEKKDVKDNPLRQLMNLRKLYFIVTTSIPAAISTISATDKELE